MRRDYLIYVLLGLVTLALFAPVVGHEFIHCDDPSYVTNNPHVQAGLTRAGVVWAFTKSYASNWHPLTWISHMLDCQMFGLKPAGHHIINLIFHTANTLLLFGVLRRMSGAVWRSAFVAALFAWHPMHVESVAWVAERKDVLSIFFWLLTMLAYARYAEESKVQGSSSAKAMEDKPKSKAPLYYCLALVCFALGLMSKPMLVTLPFVLLLLDFWPLGRIYDLRFTIYEPKDLKIVAPVKAPSAPSALPGIRKLIWEKVPFFALAAASSAITYLVQQAGGSVSTLNAVPFGFRINNALVAYLEYVKKMFWPHDLVIYYPLPPSLPTDLVVAGGFMLVVVTIGVVLWAKKRPYLAVGWLWFVGTLMPVIGLVQVGSAAFADRYMYVPGIGLFIMVSWGVWDLAGKWPQGQRLLPVASAVTLACCLMITSVQLKYWKNSITLFEHALAVTGPNVLVCVDEADALLFMGRTEEGISRLRQALAIKSDQANACSAMAIALDGQGKTMEAIPYYREALRQLPDTPELLNNMAWILAAYPDPSVRNGPEAVKFGERACKLTDYKQPFFIGTLAAAYAEAGRFQEAVETGTKAFNLSMALGVKELAQRNEELLKLYRAGQPFHGAPKEPQVTNAQ